MKIINYLIIFIVLSLSCDKKEDVLLKEELADEGINLRVKGTINSIEVDNRMALNYYDHYGNSMDREYENGDGDITVFRKSKDSKSTMRVYLKFDENHNMIEQTLDINFMLSVHVNDKQETMAYSNNHFDEVIIDNFNYDEENGNAQFDFRVVVKDERSHYIVIGKMNAKLFDIESTGRYFFQTQSN